MIRTDTLDYIKRDILEVCDDLGIDLEQKDHYYMGLCPIHNDKSPSFTVYPETQRFFCWACMPQGGDVIDLYRQLQNLSFVDARELACTKGIVPKSLKLSERDESYKELSCVAIQELNDQLPLYEFLHIVWKIEKDYLKSSNYYGAYNYANRLSEAIRTKRF